MDFAQLIEALTLTRTAILYRLIDEGSMTMGILAMRSGIAPATLTAHITILASCGLVRTWKDGRLTWVTSNCRGVEVLVAWVPGCEPRIESEADNGREE